MTGPRREAQLDLFGEPSAPRRGPPVRPAPVPDEDRALAARLPPGLLLGTSSWSFPGWRGILYEAGARPLSTQRLARSGLAAYAASPLLRAVGLDRTYYGPIPREAYARYAADVPEDFRFVVKAPVALVEPGERFLDAEHAARELVGPCTAGLAAKLGAIVFQFPPLDVAALGGPAAFAERLHGFLARLPAGPIYAVELRNRRLLRPELDAALAAAGAVPCLNVHPRMPPVAEQVARRELRRAVVVRWMLHRAFGYEQARRRYAPFDRLVDEDPASRDAIAELALAAARAGRPAFVIANNKAEGSAPLTLRALARRIAGMADNS